MINKILEKVNSISKQIMTYKRVNIEEVKREVLGIQPEEVSSESYDVYDVYDKFVRTYSVELHGKDAEKMAKQFALKINGKIK